MHPDGERTPMDVRASVTGWQSVSALVPPQPVVWLFGLPLGHVSLNRRTLRFNATPVLRALGGRAHSAFARRMRRDAPLLRSCYGTETSWEA
jgi:hypothetical protein